MNVNEILFFCVTPWKFTMNSSDIDSPLTKVMTVALLMTPTHTHTSTHTTASCAAFGLVAAATAVRRLLTSWGSGAMLRHPTLQGHVLRSKCKRLHSSGVTPELGRLCPPPNTLTCTFTHHITVTQERVHANMHTWRQTHTDVASLTPWPSHDTS